jgi:hypothetical protein
VSKCTVDPIIDKVESSSSWAFPGLANLVSQDEYWCVKGRFFWPESLSPVKHSLSHDAHTRAVEGLFQHSVVKTGLTTVAELEVFPKELLLKDPVLQLRPLAHPLFELGIVRVGEVHSFRSDEAV